MKPSSLPSTEAAVSRSWAPHEEGVAARVAVFPWGDGEREREREREPQNVTTATESLGTWRRRRSLGTWRATRARREPRASASLYGPSKVRYAAGKRCRELSREGDTESERNGCEWDLVRGGTGGSRRVEGLKRAGGLEYSYGRVGRGVSRGGTEGWVLRTGRKSKGTFTDWMRASLPSSSQHVVDARVAAPASTNNRISASRRHQPPPPSQHRKNH